MEKLKELIDLFEHNIKQYKGKHYDEAKTRVDFIDKFFELLSWDIRNIQGHSEQYRDVVREDKIEIKGKVKAPDYSFRIGGFRKFFVEAKKPSVNIKHDIEPAFQLRRYAYTAKLPLSILTDFEEFAVYDTRIKPDKRDQASTARIFYCTYKEYEKEFDFIFNTFSKQAILKGSFDQYIEDTKRERRTSEVDKEFLKFIEKWRENLAKNIALRNKDLTIYELNYAVQKIIDRIIFLRIAEDRHVEDYGKIRKLLENKKTIYPQLVNLFLQADVKYNSGLFNFKADQYTPELKIDDKILKDIIKSIYYPDSPYEFSVFDVEILGNIYEQFLGKTIRLTASHQAKIENKPEVKKAGGVYYTPKYIVDYIVKNTVGEIVACGGVPKTPKEIEKIKILDPACGSGSFLLGAYQKLMNYHLEYYTKDKNIKKSLKENKIYQIKENECRLTIEEKHKILLNNIFGVDIDSQAVEVTKLSLLLKLMEGESQESAGMLFKFSDIKMLPDLSENIKCGNSLIGSDFYDSGQMNLFQDEETTRRINVFDWHQEFPDIFKSGGFDIVIGNPPYVRIQGLQEHHNDQLEYIMKNFDSAVKRFDIYLLFIEKGFKLLKTDGKLGYICPHKFINSDFGSGIRSFLIDNKTLEKFISFGHNLIFEQASTYTCLLFLSKNGKNIFYYHELKYAKKNELIKNLHSLSSKDYSVYNINNLSNYPWILTNKNYKHILEKIDLPNKLGDIFKTILVGVQSGIDDIHILKLINTDYKDIVEVYSEREKNNIKIESGLIKPFLMGDDVKKYEKSNHKCYIIYPYKIRNNKTIILHENELKTLFPLGYNYLKKYKSELIEIRTKQKTNTKYWYSCHRSRDMNVFESERIITPYASLGCNMTIGYSGQYHNTKVYSLIPKNDRKESLNYWLGILNSPILWFFMKQTGYVLRGGYYTFTTNYLKPFPLYTINFSNMKEKNCHDTLNKVVNQILVIQKKFHSAKLETEKEMFKKQIDILDNQIDQLVYKLYGLTEKEIKTIENSTKT